MQSRDAKSDFTLVLKASADSAIWVSRWQCFESNGGLASAWSHQLSRLLDSERKERVLLVASFLSPPVSVIHSTGSSMHN